MSSESSVELKLVPGIQKQKPSTAPSEANPAAEFIEAWSSWPKTGRTRSDKRKSVKLWVERTRSVAPSRLLEAVKAYLRSKDAKKDGGEYVPGLHVWLNSKLDAWLEETERVSASASNAPNWENRYSVLELTGNWLPEWGPRPNECGHLGPRSQLNWEAIYHRYSRTGDWRVEYGPEPGEPGHRGPRSDIPKF